jgi:ABC-type spermidine/putrescine transport system permease subunit II
VRHWVWVLLSAPILFLLVLPMLIVIPIGFTSSSLMIFPPPGFSLRWFAAVLSDPQWMSALAVSLKVAALATFIGCAGGALAAFGLMRAKGAFASAAAAILMLPLVVPLIVLAFADYGLYNRLGLVGHWQAISIAHAVLGTPYAYVLVRASLSNLDPALARAALSLGANALTTFWHVYWPAMTKGVIGAGVIVFALSFDDVVLAFFLQSPGAQTVPVKMFTDIQYGLSPGIAAMAALVLAIAGIAGIIGYAFDASRGLVPKRTTGLLLRE